MHIRVTMSRSNRELVTVLVSVMIPSYLVPERMDQLPEYPVEVPPLAVPHFVGLLMGVVFMEPSHTSQQQYFYLWIGG
jgi:hypothetical protein